MRGEKWDTFATCCWWWRVMHCQYCICVFCQESCCTENWREHLVTSGSFKSVCWHVNLSKVLCLRKNLPKNLPRIVQKEMNCKAFTKHVVTGLPSESCWKLCNRFSTEGCFWWGKERFGCYSYIWCWGWNICTILFKDRLIGCVIWTILFLVLFAARTVHWMMKRKITPKRLWKHRLFWNLLYLDRSWLHDMCAHVIFLPWSIHHFCMNDFLRQRQLLLVFASWLKNRLRLAILPPKNVVGSRRISQMVRRFCRRAEPRPKQKLHPKCLPKQRVKQKLHPKQWLPKQRVKQKLDPNPKLRSPAKKLMFGTLPRNDS